MSQRVGIFVVLAIAGASLPAISMAQKPPAPPPPSSPPASNPGRTPNSPFPNSTPGQPATDLVLFLRGRVATSDNSPIPHDVMVERICNNEVRQQSYAAPTGDFTMQLGTQSRGFLDATAAPDQQFRGTGKDPVMGIPRSELRNCELRTSSPGFLSSVVNLVALDTFSDRIDVGVIVVQRSAKTKGASLSALPYQAPKNAQRAYEKGLAADRKANLPSAQKYFESAVGIYPRYTIAWFQLGSVLQKQQQKEAARHAFTQATALDNRYLPPYLSLASIAFEEGNWPLLLALSSHILNLDPLNHANVTGFIADLDTFNCADAYFYNAAANFQLNKIDEAQKSALKAEQIALPARFPQVHLLLGEIFARKNDYATAISELNTYLELAPNATNADQVRARLAKLQQLNDSAKTAQKPAQM